MTPANNPPQQFPCPSLAAIHHRRRELLSYQATQRPAQADAPLEEPLAVEDSYLEEDDRLAQDTTHPTHTTNLRKTPNNPIPQEIPRRLPPRLPRPRSPGRLSTAWPASLSVPSPRTPRPVPRPSSCNSSPPSAISSAPRLTARRSHPSRPQPLRRPGRRIQQGPQRHKLASDRQPLRPGRPLWVARRITTARPTPYGIVNALRDHIPPPIVVSFFSPRNLPPFSTCSANAPASSPPAPLRLGWRRPLRPQWKPSPPGHQRAPQHRRPHHRKRARPHLTRIESHNGFANRCLWTSVRRGQSLPEGGGLPRTSSPRWPASSAAPWTGRKPNRILFRRTPEARELWMDRYPALSEGRQDVYGAATSRAEAQVLRLSALYAALDRSSLSKPPISTLPWPCGTTVRPAPVSSSTSPHRSHGPAYQ